jgi:alkylation response protein AidB-like acyl-CoA dehydrogenase
VDLTFSEDEQAITDLAAQILGGELPPERLRDLERDDEWFARDAWLELAKADLLGIALPSEVGGGGYGIVGACLVAEQVGRAVAPVPYVPSSIAALAVAEHGTDIQRDALLPGAIAGTTILTAALSEPGEHAAPAIPAVQAVRRDGAWELTGEKALVPGAHLAHRVLVPARTGEGEVGVFLVDPHADGVAATRETAVSLEPLTDLRLDGVVLGADDVLGGPNEGARIVGELVDRTIAALCWMMLGVCEGALALTASHVSEREQFGTKIGTFQAVAQRAADAYIDTEAVRLTSWQAAWRLAEGLPAEESLAVAKFWAAEGGQRVVHAAQHLHGGVGVDVDYPLHRYFRWAKVLELTLGGAALSLLKLGDVLARPSPV